MMLEKLKKQIVTTVEATEDEALLQDIADMLSQNRSDENETNYRKRLEESIKQADRGQLTSGDTVHQMARQWITK